MPTEQKTRAGQCQESDRQEIGALRATVEEYEKIKGNGGGRGGKSVCLTKIRTVDVSRRRRSAGGPPPLRPPGAGSHPAAGLGDAGSGLSGGRGQPGERGEAEPTGARGEGRGSGLRRRVGAVVVYKIIHSSIAYPP